MSDNANNQNSGQTPARQSKKRLLIAAFVLVMLGAGAAGGYMYFQQQPGQKHVEQVKPKPPVFVKLEPFTVNLQDKDNPHMLQTEINLQVGSEKDVETVQQGMPVLRNALLLLLSSKTTDELSSLAGKQKLSDEIRNKANSVIAKPAHSIVSSVYFNSFIIQ